MPAWQEVTRFEDDRVHLGVLVDKTDPSPTIDLQRRALIALDMKGDCLPIEIPSAEFPEAIEHLAKCGFAGLSVERPLKVFAAKFATRFWVARQSQGVANALKFQDGIYAQNTEIPAIVSLISKIEPGLALVLGSGPAARSVTMALFDQGWQVRVWNRNALRSRPMVSYFQRFGKVEMSPNPDPSGCRLVANATPLGKKAGEQPPLLWAYVRPKTAFLDMVYRRVPTEFLRSASGRGLATIDGREVVIEQLALAVEWWLGGGVLRNPLREVMGLRAVVHPIS
ncbi:MAG: hypothetical protein HYR64_06055 [Fimbriimonas ginsengisoli]|uniref:Shikimate dehydrogenase n=1 Tax=Fimbriimonas ginsengisoli TaxID=1005039 RepID=A0A931LUX9_FIMGI|nr:hypothetical protein [Fimbriimonas ginsengisoli]